MAAYASGSGKQASDWAKPKPVKPKPVKPKSVKPKPQVEVHKFGGAAVCDAEGLRRAAGILKARMAQAKGQKAFVVVVSAMGKTTAGLEQAVRAAWNGANDALRQHLQPILEAHQRCLEAVSPDPRTKERVEALLTALEERLQQTSPTPEEADFDAHYDEVVAFGERLSSCLLAACLEGQAQSFAEAARDDPSEQLAQLWSVVLHDARSLIHTDGQHREAIVDLDRTYTALRQALDTAPGCLAVLPGFIGRSPQGATTTLGLEGSDYTAALAAAALNAHSVTLWKNVPGVFQADPARFPEALPLPQLDFEEVFQMTNYGAKVIHPKTMQPLQEAQIALHVRSFLDPQAPGTDIGPKAPKQPYPPITVMVDHLHWLRLRHRTLKYLTERDIARIFALLREQRAKAYCTDIGRMTLSVGVWVDARRWSSLQDALEQQYALDAESGLELVTVRHPARRDGQSAIAFNTPHAGNAAGHAGRIYLEQQSGDTYQCLRKA